MTREEQIDWLCRLRSDLNNRVIFTPWNKEFTEALTDILEQVLTEIKYDRLVVAVDDIRAMIQWLPTIEYPITPYGRVYISRDDVLSIIDKYCKEVIDE